MLRLVRGVNNLGIESGTCSWVSILWKAVIYRYMIDFHSNSPTIQLINIYHRERLWILGMTMEKRRLIQFKVMRFKILKMMRTQIQTTRNWTTYFGSLQKIFWRMLVTITSTITVRVFLQTRHIQTGHWSNQLSQNSLYILAFFPKIGTGEILMALTTYHGQPINTFQNIAALVGLKPQHLP